MLSVQVAKRNVGVLSVGRATIGRHQLLARKLATGAGIKTNTYLYQYI